ncbi:MAG TPA: phosphatase PAP2 family protein [Pyrinomonadaceae bacterium]|nr:phosphatase PAP2 family protein [Pyrinomonadaceae bacterium]
MKNQIHPKTFAGWQLAVGLLVFAVMTVIVGELGERIVREDQLTAVDAKLSTWLHANRSQTLTRALRIATGLGSTWWAICTALAFGIFLISRRQLYWLAASWLSVFGGMLLNMQLKSVFHRARPSFHDPVLSLTGYSFPSGHTMAATVLYTILAAYLATHAKHGVTRALVIIAAAILIIIVGFSRIYLGAHYLSDVLGAMAEGLAWSTLCLALFHTAQRHRAGKKKAG